MIDLWLIRHGESIGNVDGTDADTDLSPRGCEQARQLATALETIPFDAVWASPLRRARQTAALALPKASPRIDPRLAEFRPGPPVQFVDPSSFDLNAFGKSNLVSSYGPIETGKDFIARVKAWLADVPPGCIAAFTHFGVVREILSIIVGFRNVPQEIPHASVYRIEKSAIGSRAVLWWAPSSEEPTRFKRGVH